MKIKITILESRCRMGYCGAGEEFIYDGLCPPVCGELWNAMWPYIFALENGALLDEGENRTRAFTVRCPDGGRVTARGEALEDEHGKSV